MGGPIRKNMYSLYSDDKAQELCTAGSLVGFFVDSEGSWRTFYAVRYSPNGQRVREDVEHLEVRVLDFSGEVMVAYSMSDVRI